MKSTIYGSGANSKITLYRIHQGEGYFKRDTSTRHSQIMLLQTELNGLGYDCGTPDGKYGSKTTAGVRQFQQVNDLAVDGLFGKESLAALESVMGNVHLTDSCFDSDDLGAHGCYDDSDSSLNAAKYKASSDPDISYADKDCANYVYAARNRQGAHGATSELAYHVEFFGSIKDLGGYDYLIPGMELFQGFRKTATSNRFYASHIGVYAGEQMVNGNLIPSVYQSSDSYPHLQKKYSKTSGPNLTSLSDHWNYWGWSKYIRLR